MLTQGNSYASWLANAKTHKKTSHKFYKWSKNIYLHCRYVYKFVFMNNMFVKTYIRPTRLFNIMQLGTLHIGHYIIISDAIIMPLQQHFSCRESVHDYRKQMVPDIFCMYLKQTSINGNPLLMPIHHSDNDWLLFNIVCMCLMYVLFHCTPSWRFKVWWSRVRKRYTTTAIILKNKAHLITLISYVLVNSVHMFSSKQGI